MKTVPITIDTGTAYGRPKPTYRSELTEVGAGTSAPARHSPNKSPSSARCVPPSSITYPVVVL